MHCLFLAAVFLAAAQRNGGAAAFDCPLPTAIANCLTFSSSYCSLHIVMLFFPLISLMKYNADPADLFL